MSPDRLFQRLQELLGKEAVAGPAEAAGFVVGGCSPAVGAVSPASVEEVCAAVRFCSEHALKVIPLGGATMAERCSAPCGYDVALSTRRLDRVTDYQRENLVFAAQSGVTGAQTVALLTPGGQMLALDPPSFPEATLGGMVAARASGPSRAGYGAPRDLVLGLKVVDARGELVSAGGKVMKNAAGYDLCRLYTGSLGTLGVIVETVFRLHPAPEASRAFVGMFGSWEDADRAVARMQTAPLVPRAVELLNREAARMYCPDGHAEHAVYLLAAFDGTEEQLACQQRTFESILQETGARGSAELDFAWNGERHRSLCDLERTPEGGTLLILSGLPSDIPVLVSHVEEVCAEAGCRPVILAGAVTGTVRAVCPGVAAGIRERAAAALRGRVSGVRGVSLRVFAREPLPHEMVWATPAPGIDVMRRIKDQLDPDRVFPAGRFPGGL